MFGNNWLSLAKGREQTVVPSAAERGAADRVLIVTRHMGLVEFLRRQGIMGEIITRVDDPEQLRGRDVFGPPLPLALAAHARTLTIAEMDLPVGIRPPDLSADEMVQHGARLVTFVIREVSRDAGNLD